MFNALRDRVKSWKVIAFHAAYGLPAIAGAIDELRGVDVSPLLPPAYATKIIAGIALFSIFMHLAVNGKRKVDA